MKQLLKRTVSSVASSRLLKPLGPPLLHASQFVLGLSQREVVYFGQPSRKAAATRIREIVTSFPKQTIGVDELYVVRCAVLATRRVPGVLAEVGVFRGCSARVIGEAKGDAPLHLFDTFEGLPEPGERDTWFKKGQYACDLATVQAYLADLSNVHYHPGLFPATSSPVADQRFSFVHLDVDLYDSTLAALEFFYPRMSQGAMLVSHDYVEFRGVHEAFDTYFQNINQPVLELPGNQCLVVKVAS